MKINMKINKRIILLVITLVMLASTVTYGNGLSEDIGGIQGTVGPVIITNSLWDYQDTRIQKYTMLSIGSHSEVTGLSELKKEINTNFTNYETNFTIIYNGDTMNLEEDMDRIIDERKKEDEYFAGTYTQIRYGYEYTSSWAEIQFVVKYYTNKAQEEFVNLEVKRVIEDIIEDEMNDFEKVKSINDWIVLNTEYSDNTNTSPHATYTLFKEGKGVCQAYALATYRLLEEAGLQARYVTGNAGEDEVAHAWNQVKVDGKWYNLDTTWNDPTPKNNPITNNPGRVSYAYFLISDSSIGIDHFKDELRTYEVANHNDYEYMNEMSHAITLEDYIYYSSKNNGNKLYKNKIQTGEKTKVIDNVAQYIVGYGDYIYYSNYSHGGYINKIKTDGTGNEELNKVHATDLYIEYPYVFYYDETNSTKEKIRIEDPIYVSGISLNKSNVTLTVDAKPVKLEAIIEPIDATDKDIIWESSNPSVATVKDGIITGVKAGNSVITVRTKDGNFTDTANIIVKEGYKIFPLNEEQSDPKYTWKVKLNKPIKAESVNFNSVYIEDEYGEKLNGNNFNIETSKNNPALININVISGAGYLKDRLYYVVVDKSLKSLENKDLLNPVKMPFIIK